MKLDNRTANELIGSEYLRTRLSPKFEDYYYLCLSDLLIALKRESSDHKIMVLDYGCGGSPYRSLFPNAVYKRADIEQADGDRLDYLLDARSNISEKDETFDLVLSSQVAEHLVDPKNYFSECFRLLKSGGKLICTTHGYFPDHGCPYDFQRWTADGLRRDIHDAGFTVKSVEKLTTGARAFFSILDFSMSHLEFPRSSIYGAGIFLARKAFRFLRPGLYRYLDAARPNERIVADANNEYSFYIGLIAIAVKE